MNTDISRAQAMRQAGYSNTSAEHPAKIENSDGFKLALAGIFAQSGNVSMAILNEMDAKINAGELKKQDMKSLVNYFDVMTRAMERIAPKESKATIDDVSRIFAGIVGGDTTGETQDNKDSEQSSDTMQDLTSIVKDSIVHDNDSQVLQHETSEMSSDTVA